MITKLLNTGMIMPIEFKQSFKVLREMGKTEKEKRLEHAIETSLKDDGLFDSIPGFIEVISVIGHLQDAFDEKGGTMMDMSILEEAQSGRFTAEIKIKKKAGIPGEPQGIEITVKNVEGRFRVLGYKDRAFSVEIDTPIQF